MARRIGSFKAKLQENLLRRGLEASGESASSSRAGEHAEWRTLQAKAGGWISSRTTVRKDVGVTCRGKGSGPWLALNSARSGAGATGLFEVGQGP